MSRFAVVYEDPEYDTELSEDDSYSDLPEPYRPGFQGGFYDVSGMTAAEIKYLKNSD